MKEEVWKERRKEMSWGKKEGIKREEGKSLKERFWVEEPGTNKGAW